ncbi:MAG: ribbon-helix-helix protein, CopG family [Acidimicrobiia bacterium]
MIRTQISLTEEQMQRARRRAARRGVSLAALVREALERLLEDSSAEHRRARAKQAVGGFRSGHTGTSERHDEVLGEHRW